MSTKLQQIKQGTKRKVNGLFFIKSKHARPIFKNHSYFQMKQKNNPQPCAALEQAQTSKKWSMFVNQPSGYGIENTFRFMCDQIRQSNKHLALLNKITTKKKQNNQQNQEQGLEEREKSNTEIKHNQRHHQHHNDSRVRQTKTVAKHSRLKSNERLNTQPTNRYLQTTESFNYRIRKTNRVATIENMQTYRRQEPTQMDSPASHTVELIYVGGRSYYLDVQTQCKIHFNILPYILHCFFKCRVNYSKNLTQSQYDKIRACIQQTKMTTRSHFDVKDIINFSSVKQILQMLDIYGACTHQWYETIRYFFIPKSQILDYQYNKLIDQLKLMTILKFNVELIDQKLYVYRIQDKVRVNNLYEMLRPGTYIYSESKDAYQIYCDIIKRKTQIDSYKNRIHRWRSVAPLDQTNSDRRRSKIHTAQADNESNDKYKKLFQLTKQRRSNQRNRKSTCNTNGVLLTNLNYSSFIDKSKLHQAQDIFQ